MAMLRMNMNHEVKGHHIVKALSGGVLPVSGVLADDEVEIFYKNPMEYSHQIIFNHKTFKKY